MIVKRVAEEVSKLPGVAHACYLIGRKRPCQPSLCTEQNQSLQRCGDRVRDYYLNENATQKEVL